MGSYRICRVLLQFGLRTLNTLLSAFRHGHSNSVNIYVCMHRHYRFLCSSSFNYQHHIARCQVRLKGPGAFEVTVVHEVQRDVRCNRRVSRALCQAPSENSYRFRGPMIQRKVILSLMFSIGLFFHGAFYMSFGAVY